MKYNVGDKVRIKSLDWYNENKDEYGYIDCGSRAFFTKMSDWCGKIVTIKEICKTNCYHLEEYDFDWTDEMIEGLVEEEIKHKFKVGDILFYRGETSGYLKVEEIRVENGEIRYYETSRNIYLVENDPDVFADKVCSVETEETKSEDKLLDDYEELTDRAFKGGYEKCKSDIKLNGFQLPDGYIFKDENGNEIRTSKIILEKVNTLKTQSDNMETETHRGYCTTEPETTNKCKKVAWFTFWDNDFADKVELDLSNRELIQEDGKWFVVKKKKEYPKTYAECYQITGLLKTSDIYGYKNGLLFEFQKLLIALDAYWKIAGEEMGLGKPWEPDWNTNDNHFYTIHTFNGKIECSATAHRNAVLIFPTEEMRDAFYENFKSEIEICKELL